MKNGFSRKYQSFLINQVEDITYKKLEIINRNNFLQYFFILIVAIIIDYFKIDIQWFWFLVAGFIISRIFSIISKRQQSKIDLSKEISDIFYEIDENSEMDNLYDHAQMEIQLPSQNGMHSYVTVGINPEFCKQYNLIGHKLVINTSNLETDWGKIFTDTRFSVLKESIQFYFYKTPRIFIEIKEILYHSHFIELQAKIVPEDGEFYAKN